VARQAVLRRVEDATSAGDERDQRDERDERDHADDADGGGDDPRPSPEPDH
jgi:hypothetical protein